MGKYKVYKIDTRNRQKGINAKLAKKQTLNDKVENIWDVFRKLDDMTVPIPVEFENIFNTYGSEDVSEQRNFIKKLLLEAEIVSITGEPKIRKPTLQKK